MPNELPIPDALNELIEKRNDEDRRKAERRAEEDSPIEANEERRSGFDQRIVSRREDDQ